jgi:excisionase family DNA binding protein
MNDSQTDSAKESTIGENIDMSELQLLTIPETCRILHIKTSFAYNLIRAGKLRTLKIGAKRLVKLSTIREFISDSEEND